MFLPAMDEMFLKQPVAQALVIFFFYWTQYTVLVKVILVYDMVAKNPFC